MAGEHEVKREISKDITLDCNFDLVLFPAILTSESAKQSHMQGKILMTEVELWKLAVAIADRFDHDLVRRPDAPVLREPT